MMTVLDKREGGWGGKEGGGGGFLKNLIAKGGEGGAGQPTGKQGGYGTGAERKRTREEERERGSGQSQGGEKRGEDNEKRRNKLTFYSIQKTI